MLISSLKAKKNTRLLHWPGHQRFKPRYPQSSRDGSQFHEAVLIKSPPVAEEEEEEEEGHVPFLDLRLSNDPIVSRWTRPL